MAYHVPLQLPQTPVPPPRPPTLRRALTPANAMTPLSLPPARQSSFCLSPASSVPGIPLGLSPTAQMYSVASNTPQIRRSSSTLAAATTPVMLTRTISAESPRTPLRSSPPLRRTNTLASLAENQCDMGDSPVSSKRHSDPQMVEPSAPIAARSPPIPMAAVSEPRPTAATASHLPMPIGKSSPLRLDPKIFYL